MPTRLFQIEVAIYPPRSILFFLGGRRRDPEQSRENDQAEKQHQEKLIFQEPSKERRWAHGRKPTGRLPRSPAAECQEGETLGDRVFGICRAAELRAAAE
jgi:hypothetical protein